MNGAIDQPKKLAIDQTFSSDKSENKLADQKNKFTLL